MNAPTTVQAIGGTPSTGEASSGNVKLDIHPTDGGDATHFRALLDRFMAASDHANGAVKGPSLGEKVAGRVNDLAGEIQQDQQHVSKMLEQASRTGDPMHLMKAMMALSDYEVRVQAISKTVSKTTQAFEQLTKLQ
jgi:flagellar hook-basal body complex protein FliE